MTKRIPTDRPSSRGPRPSRRPARRRPRFLPALDRTEARTLLSTVVTNDHDGGAGSLRNALLAAPDGGTITFSPALDGTTIELTSGPLVIAKGVTIKGPGAGLNGTGSVTGSSITANQAVGGSGGSQTPATGQKSPFVGSGQGGAIEIGSTSGSVTLQVSRSSFTANVARGGEFTSGDGGVALGGAISNDRGAATIGDSTFSGDVAQGGQGGRGSAGGLAMGGGVDNLGGTATVTDSTFLLDLALGGLGGSGGVGGDGAGGGIAIGAGGTTAIHRALISLCVADGGDGGDGFGGGLYSATGSVVAQQANKIKLDLASTAGDDVYSGGTIS